MLQIFEVGEVPLVIQVPQDAQVFLDCLDRKERCRSITVEGETIVGPIGSKGEPGPVGPNGFPGRDGIPGLKGQKGESGHCTADCREATGGQKVNLHIYCAKHYSSCDK